MFLPDINVWLALAFKGHANHPVAQRWFPQVPASGAALCRFTQQGLLRLATNRRVVGQEALSLVQAWGMYDALRNDPRVAFAEEPEGIEAHWRAFTQRRSFSPKVWNDAYLAAFALAGGYEVVTFDKGFKQFPGLSCTILS